MLRIIQITEKDKIELGESAHHAVKAVHQFLECLDKVSEGQISQEMARYYGERRGVPGTGRYSGRYNKRDGGYGERSNYNTRDGGYGERGDYNMRDSGYDERSDYNMRDGGYGERGYGNYGNRYDY